MNDPYRLLGLLCILILLYLPVFFDNAGMTIPELKSLIVGEKVTEGNVPYAELVDSTAPVTAWVYGLMDLIFGRSLTARHILGFLILFSQSAYFGMMLLARKAFSENTYIPSFLFSILAFFSFDTVAISSELLGSGFLLLALNNLFKEIEARVQRNETVFNLGLFISLASLCSFSFIMHLLSACAILIFYTRSSARGFVILLFGFLLPQLIIMSLYYLNDALPQLWDFYYLANITNISVNLISLKGMLALGAIPLFYVVISIVILNRDARLSKYQSQLLQTMFFWLIFSSFQISLASDFRPQSFIALIPSISFFITHFLLMIRRRKFAEMNTWMLLLGITSLSYMARYNKIDQIDYSGLIVKNPSSNITGKKILVLDDDFTLYRNNQLATPFLNWNLSREILEQPDYYENVITVYDFFKADAPEIIFDKHNAMPRLFKRIPVLENNYALKEPGVYLRKATAKFP